jgi:hypothetical protein
MRAAHPPHFVVAVQAVDFRVVGARLRPMATEDSTFEIRLGRIGRDPAPRLGQVRAAVRAATRTARGPRQGGKQPSVRAHFVKGAKSRARPVSVAQRRVVVKVRYAANAGGRGAPLRAHVAYLAREGGRPGERLEAPVEKATELSRSVDYLDRTAVAREAKFPFYDSSQVGLDARALTATWADDPRHFRMIVSAEDGEALGDLKPFVREVMAGLETKLGVKLQWVAVDHHDTDNPHTHVLIRGRRPDGQELFIPSKLIASGIREHAQEIVTRVLGPRLNVDLVRERAAEIDLKALTSLDRELRAGVAGGVVRSTRSDLAARLERLEGWGLAKRERAGWRLAPDLVPALKAMAEREDVERIAARYQRAGETMPLLEADRASPSLGELVHLGPADEFGDRFLAIVETGRGELRYARFEKADDLAILADAQPGAIVTLTPNIPAVRPSDEAVARIASRTGGLYSIDQHLGVETNADIGLAGANVRRLEAMRRMNLIHRRTDGTFEIGPDHMDKALAFEERLAKRAPFAARVLSYWSLEEQVHAAGLTHMDRVLAGEAASPDGGGRLHEAYDDALQRRRLFLIEQGWMGGGDRTLSRQAIQQMAQVELSARAHDLARDLGLPVQTHVPNRVAGVYAQRIDLAQGRMALILGDRQAFLVPWRPPLERFAGRQVEGVLRGQGLSWSLSRGLGINLPPM